MPNCKKCKKEIPDGALYCPWCGAAQRKNPKKKMYQRPDGLYEQVKTINGKRVYFRGKTEKEVADKMVAYQEQQDKGPLFVAVAESCQEAHYKTIAHQTQRCYDAGYADLIDRFNARYALDITPFDIRLWVDELRRKGYAYKTIRNRLSVAKAIYRYLCGGSYGDLDYDPTRNIEIPRGLPKSSREPASSEDIKRILDHPDSPAGLLMVFLLLTGLRIGEAQAIQGEDIDRENRLLRVRKSVYYIQNRPYVKEPKTSAGVRVVPLPDYLLALLPSLVPKAYLFADEKGELLHFTRLRRMLQKYKTSYGISATPHQLRHAYATILHDANLSAKDAQHILGHSSITVTEDIYTHISQERQREVSIKLNQFITARYAANSQNTEKTA